MRRPIVKMVLLLGLGAFCLGRPAWAQNREKAWELMPWVGSVSFGKKAGLNKTFSYGLRFGYHWTKHNEVEFGFAGASTQDSATRQLNADMLSGEVNYVYNFFLHRRDKVVAYLTGGLDIVSFSTFGFVSNPDLVGDENDLGYNYGGGIRFFGSRKVGFRIDARQIHYTPSGSGTTQDYIQYGAGITLILGGA